MHYRDGTEAKVGDFVKGKSWDGKTILGQVQSVTPGATSCNMQVAYTTLAPVAAITTAMIGEYDLVRRDGPPAE